MWLLSCVRLTDRALVDLTPVNFNWNILIFSVVLLIAATYFIFRGRKVYTGPVLEVRKVL